MKKLILISSLILLFSCTKESYTVTCSSKQLNATTVQEFDTYKQAKAYKNYTETMPQYHPELLDLGGNPVLLKNDCHCDIQ